MKIVIIIILTLSITTSFAQKVYTTTDGYVAINAERIPSNYSEVRNDEFAPGGRVKRHPYSGDANKKISMNFIIAPKNIFNAIEGNLTWAEAAGWHTNANASNYDVTNETADTGCSQYQGKDGTDAKGTWRLPTQRELILMWILNPALKNKSEMTPLSEEYYFSATEDGYDPKTVCVVNFKDGDSNSKNKDLSDSAKIQTRCIKDVKLTTPTPAKKK